MLFSSSRQLYVKIFFFTILVEYDTFAAEFSLAKERICWKKFEKYHNFPKKSLYMKENNFST